MGRATWTIPLVASLASVAGLAACGEDDDSPKGLSSAGMGGGGTGGSTSIVLGGAGSGGKGGVTSMAGSTSPGAGGDDSVGVGGAPPRPVPPDLPSGWLPRSEFLPPEGSASSPDVVIDSTGIAHVVMWGPTLWITPLDENGFGTPQALFEPGYRAALSINDADQGILLYLSNDGLHSAHHTLEGGWTLGDTIGATTEPEDFGLAISSTGDALSVWVEGTSAEDASVRSAFYDGATWTAPVEVGYTGYASLARPALGIDDLGRGAVFWRATPEGEFLLHDYCAAAIFDGSIWSAPAKISGELYGCYLPDLAMRGNGDALGVYEYEYDLYAIDYTVAGGWGTGVNISNAAESGTYAGRPEIAFDAAGNALVAWREEIIEGNGNYALHYNRYTAGAWETAQTLTMPAEHIMDPSAQLAVNGAGQGIVAWAATSYDGYVALFASRYTPGTGFEEPFVLDAGLDDWSSLQTDINEAGDIVIVWQRRIDGSYHPFATYFAAP